MGDSNILISTFNVNSFHMLIKTDQNGFLKTNPLHVNTNNIFLWKLFFSREIKVHIELSENENMTFHNLWKTAKAVLKGTCIELNTLEKSNDFESII